MPPGPIFNWLAVAATAADILTHAAHIRATRATAVAASLRQPLKPTRHKRRRVDIEKEDAEAEAAVRRAGMGVKKEGVGVGDIGETGWERSGQELGERAVGRGVLSEILEHGTSTPIVDSAPSEPVVTTPPPPLPLGGNEPTASFANLESQEAGPSNVSWDAAVEEITPPSYVQQVGPFESEIVPSINDAMYKRRSVQLESSKVPSSRLGRLFHYGGLAASLGYGAAAELVRRSASSGEESSSSLMLTEANVKRLVNKLTKMRGAALKLGQFMSIQDSHVLPPQIEDIFRRVQDSAHYMPDWQMEEVMRQSLGPDWHLHFDQFDRIPFAAASIGQVHSAILKAASSPTGQPAKVAVKIQFPNIVNSIQSDLGYVKMLLTAGRLLPKGLFLDRTLEVMKSELADECNYKREASFLRRFGEPSHLGADPRFKVPWVWNGSTERVLAMEHVDGVSVGGSVIDKLSQRDRDDIATRIIDLCLKELFVFRVMQTDPNWTNFLWNYRTRQVELVDFGATREYSRTFIDSWLRLLQAAASDDRDACIEWSLKVGYLTGGENELMLDAHARSMALLATPFKAHTPQPFSFGPGSDWSRATSEIRTHIPVMLQNRLTPPPRESYSLNRKLSGAFLLAARLNARVDCRQLWEGVTRDYRFGEDMS